MTPANDITRAGYLFTIFVDFLTRCEFHPEACLVLDNLLEALEQEADTLVNDDPEDMIEHAARNLVLEARKYVKTIIAMKEAESNGKSVV